MQKKFAIGVPATTVLAFVEHDAKAVAEAMAGAARKAGIDGRAETARPSPLGAHQVNAI